MRRHTAAYPPPEWLPAAVVQELLSKTAVLKLNGGLGTSMGLEKAKSLLVVRDGKTFLDLIAEQVEHTRGKMGAKVRCGPWSTLATPTAGPLAQTLSVLVGAHPLLPTSVVGACSY